MVRNFGIPVNVLPLIRLGRYTALLAGIAYGAYRHGVLQNYEDNRRAAKWQRDTVYRLPPNIASPMPGQKTTITPNSDKKDGTAIPFPTEGIFGPGDMTIPGAEIDWISILPVTGKESTVTGVSTPPDNDNKDGTVIPFPTEGIVDPGDTTVPGAEIDRISILPVNGKETTVTGISTSSPDDNKDGTIIPFSTEGIVDPGDTTVNRAEIDRISILPVNGKETTVTGISTSSTDDKKDGTVIPFPTESTVGRGDMTVTGVSTSSADEKTMTGGRPVYPNLTDESDKPIR